MPPPHPSKESGTSRPSPQSRFGGQASSLDPICPSCRRVNRLEARFCSDCGTPLAAVPGWKKFLQSRTANVGAVAILILVIAAAAIRMRLESNRIAAAKARQDAANLERLAAESAAAAKAGSKAWASLPRPAPRPETPVNGAQVAAINWVSIPGGSFMMGSDPGDADQMPRHRVSVKGFQIAKTLVTNRQYKACVAAGACTMGESYGPSFEGDDQPVVGIDWSQARAFSHWVGGRLPTEAEWEYAARGAGQDNLYPWGDSEATCALAVISGCGNAPAPVCSKPAGRTRQGLCDMAGNAWEWVEDYYHDSYEGAPADGSAWVDDGSYRVNRGGSWLSDAASVRAVLRGGDAPDLRRDFLSFRPAR